MVILNTLPSNNSNVYHLYSALINFVNATAIFDESAGVISLTLMNIGRGNGTVCKYFFH